ncbi:PX domain-containing protein kinase-like protein [Pollicipes pollicipes]|uniref:PX domain-containing protein kinase-like protein n=1 Tax=Pollicipes pollicipes TaxID=41117 RepID=UPI001884AFFF|nr:PX domain-containing protein kinase-like protein [Pollicipes pollicipes]
MQMALQRQYKADKRAEQSRAVKQEKEQEARQAELRSRASLMRKKERQKWRHENGEPTDSDSDDSHFSDGSTPAAPPPPPPPPPPHDTHRPGGQHSGDWGRHHDDGPDRYSAWRPLQRWWRRQIRGPRQR